MRLKPAWLLPLLLPMLPLAAQDRQAARSEADALETTIRGDAMLRAINGLGNKPAGETVTYFAADPMTRGYLAVPEGEGPFPAVLLIHEWDGLVKRIRQTADAFAELGYIALAADLYRGRTGGSRDENIELMRQARADQQAIIDNLDAAVSYIREQTPATGKVAAIGWCFGGGVALSYALGSDAHDGTAIFYGSLLDDPEEMRKIHHEIYGTFAARDRGIPVRQVNDFVEALRQAGIDNDVHIYDHVRHGFWLYNERDPEHNRPAAIHAWERLKAYLKRVLS